MSAIHKKATLIIPIIVVAVMAVLSDFTLFSCAGKQEPAKPITVPDKPEVHEQDTVPADHFCKTIARYDLSKPGHRAATVNASLWPNGTILKIKFIGGTASQRKYFTDAFQTWASYVNIVAAYVTSGNADIRVAFSAGDGSWSFIGTDCKSEPQSRPTINIGWSGADVCLHELGHMLGMAHEQSSPNSSICWNKDQVYKDLGGSPNFWSKQTVDFNVFQKLTPSEATATQFDQNSIMQYPVPGTWTCDGKGIPGGKTLSALDISYMSSVYPKQIQPPPATKTKVALEQWKRDTILKWLNAATPIQ